MTDLWYSAAFQLECECACFFSGFLAGYIKVFEGVFQLYSLSVEGQRNSFYQSVWILVCLCTGVVCECLSVCVWKWKGVPSLPTLWNLCHGRYPGWIQEREREGETEWVRRGGGKERMGDRETEWEKGRHRGRENVCVCEWIRQTGTEIALISLKPCLASELRHTKHMSKGYIHY